MEIVKYKLLNKRQNDSGVSVTFEKKTERIEEFWVSRDPKTLWEKFISFFGERVGRMGTKVVEDVSEFDVFYPIESRVHFKTRLCYLNGSKIPYEVADQLKNLIEISKFKEQPVKEFIKKD